MAVKTAILKGTLYLQKVGTSGLLSTGNSTKITLSTEIEEKSLPNVQTPGGGNDDSFKRVKAVKLSVSFRHLPRTVLEIAFGAKVTSVAGGAVIDEAHPGIALDALIKTNKRQDMSIPLVVKKGAVVLVEGVDYVRKRAGIVALAGGALVALDDLTFSYTALAVVRIDGMMNSSAEYFGVFDGVNERNNGPACGDFYRLLFGPAQNVELVGDDFVSFDCTAECLSDPAKPATASPFYHFEIGGID